MSTATPVIAFVWENFGPIHADRCDAVARSYKNRRKVVGIEICGVSSTYAWVPEAGNEFEKTTLFPGAVVEEISTIARFWRTVRACISCGARDVFFCHYEHPATLLSAVTLRLLGRHVFVMNDSKYDDYTRYFWREFIKRFFYLPYQGGLASGLRSQDYLRFLGLRKRYVSSVYNALSVERVRKQGGGARAPGGTPFANRHFSVIARFVPKKNISTMIDAYKIYFKATTNPRPLHLYGSGVLEASLKEQIQRAGLDEHIKFCGFLQAAEISRALGSTLALLLSSVEEQFGNVVIEAQAMGVPVVLSANCGVCDTMIQSTVNAFVVEATNAEGFAFYMHLLAENEALWRKMSLAAERYVYNCDAERFAEAVSNLVEPAQ